MLIIKADKKGISLVLKKEWAKITGLKYKIITPKIASEYELKIFSKSLKKKNRDKMKNKWVTICLVYI